MEWLFYIFGGLFLFYFLKSLGFIAEFFGMIGIVIIVSLISGAVAWMFNWGFDVGAPVGVVIGFVMYAIYCIKRIVNPEITLKVYEDGSYAETSERGRGIVGLIMLVVGVLYCIFS